MQFKRHTFIDINDLARARIIAECTREGVYSEEVIREIILPKQTNARIPGVVRREDPALCGEGMVPVGFSSFFRVNGQRIRVPTFIHQDEILSVSVPYEFSSQKLPERTLAIKAWSRICSQTDLNGLDIGVWGSVAHEIYTGLPWTDDASDLDIIVRSMTEAQLRFLFNYTAQLEAELGIRIDTELENQSGYGVSVKELFSDSVSSVLGKGISDIVLLETVDVLASLPT